MQVLHRKPLVSGEIAKDYYYNYNHLASRFEVAPDDYMQYAKRVTNNLPHRRELSECLQVYNEKLGAGKKSIANAGNLAREDCLVVVAGQQTGFLTGPALTIYKAMTAVRMADKLSSQLQRPVVPIFWMAGEDHDYAEVNRLQIIDVKNRRKLIESRTKPLGRPSAGSTTIFKEDEFFHRLAAALPDTDWGQKLVTEIKQAAEEATDLNHWFGFLMLKLMGKYGLVMMNPMLPEIRKISQPIFQRAIIESAELQHQLLTGERALRELGYTPEITKKPGHMNLFYYDDDGNRMPLYLHQDQVCTRGELADWQMPLADLIAICQSDPAKFSPGVALRPVLQDYLLPTALFVAGPGEINYLAQLKEVYRGFGISMPPIYPRAQITVVGLKENNILRELAVGDDWLETGFKQYIEKYLAKRDPVNISETINEKKRIIKEQHQQLVEQFEQLDNKFSTIGEENWQKIDGHLSYMAKKAVQSLRKKHREFLKRVDTVEDVLSPGGNCQENIYSFYSLLIYFGETLLPILDQVDFTDVWHHQLVYLSKQIHEVE
ncbi:bacillithiol biosynthesis cysteine-adding enzyme BshC [Metallumcola ferriviriculae]|uniref:Putative cysteine ligase BshC n=1 Tax=Metallumcola ferriviriculae TaxID=3039180 RepID=A0AAU0UP36_9FIRM|nr:bacillithiol biosynthesis cysteine-adding enzyme BshC [Desulfitibacteraceae bacterium MK1]